MFVRLQPTQTRSQDGVRGWSLMVTVTLLANQRPLPSELPSAVLYKPDEHQVCQRFGVLPRGGLVLHQKAVIERPIQSIQHKIQIYILSQLTVRLLSPQQLLRFLSARSAPDRAKGGGHIRVAARRYDERPQHL